MKGKKIFLVSFICISFMITAVPAAQTKKVSKVDGSVTISGALNGSFKWKEDLALFCGCVPDVKVGKIEVTMTDGAGTFIAIDASMDGELTLTSKAGGSAVIWEPNWPKNRVLPEKHG